jgi:hypothetical protein
VFRGTAEILPVSDKDAKWAMSRKRIQRMNLDTDLEQAGATMAFVRIIPEPTVFCYGLGFTIMEMRANHTNVGYKVIIPAERR